MKVIIAIDDSAYCKRVLETIAARKWPMDTDFRIMSVVEPIKWDEVENESWKDVTKQAFNRRKKMANRVCAEGKEIIESKHPDCTVHIEVREGNPRHEIIEAAIDWMADKILIGAHGHDLCDRFVWGGVSRAVAVKSPCSVEIVRPRALHPREAKNETDAAESKADNALSPA
jgi:nucleotide-binding universal stress UspA family protein